MLLDSNVQGSDRIDVQVKLMLIIDSSSQCGLLISISEMSFSLFSYRLIRWFQCRFIQWIIIGINRVVSVVKLLQVLNSMFIQLVFLLQVVVVGLLELKWVLVMVVVVQIYIVNSVNQEKNCIYVSCCMVCGMVCRLLMMIVSMCCLGIICVMFSSRLQVVYNLVSMQSILLLLCYVMVIVSVMLSVIYVLIWFYVGGLVNGVFCCVVGGLVLLKLVSFCGEYLWVLNIVYVMDVSSIVVLKQNVQCMVGGILLVVVVLVMLKWVRMNGRKLVMMVLMLMKKFCIVQLVGCCCGESLLLMKVWNGFIEMLMEVFSIYSVLVVIYKVGEFGIISSVSVVNIVLIMKYGWWWFQCVQVWLDRQLMIGCISRLVSGVVIYSLGMVFIGVFSVLKMWLVLVFCSVKLNWMLRKLKYMFQICQNDSVGLVVWFIV